MEIIHNKPAWQTRADFVIGANISDVEWGKNYVSEQLAVKQIGESKFEICCIPFALYNICIGDMVIVDEGYNLIRLESKSDILDLELPQKMRTLKRH